jgi:hypothetical protein
MTDHDIQQNPEAQSTTAASRRKRRLRRWATGMMIALTLYAAAGFLLAPHLVQRYVPQFASEQLQREAEIGEVRINPFLLTFDARDFAFREADGRPILALSRLFVDLEVKSLFRWAWTLAEIRLEAPDLHLVLGDDARLNLARLADAFPAETSPEPADEPGPPPRLVLEKVVLQQGTLTFTDETVPETARLVATPLNLELRDISTLPERRGPYGLRARLPGGGEVTWEGELALNPIASNGTLESGRCSTPHRTWPNPEAKSTSTSPTASPTRRVRPGRCTSTRSRSRALTSASRTPSARPRSRSASALPVSDCVPARASAGSTRNWKSTASRPRCRR